MNYWTDRKEEALKIEAGNAEIRLQLFHSQQLVKSLTETKYLLIEELKKTRAMLEKGVCG